MADNLLLHAYRRDYREAEARRAATERELTLERQHTTTLLGQVKAQADDILRLQRQLQGEELSEEDVTRERRDRERYAALAGLVVAVAEAVREIVYPKDGMAYAEREGGKASLVKTIHDRIMAVEKITDREWEEANPEKCHPEREGDFKSTIGLKDLRDQPGWDEAAYQSAIRMEDVGDGRILDAGPDGRETVMPMATAAFSTLEGLGYTWTGGKKWRPPLGPAPDFEKMDRVDELAKRIVSLEDTLASRSDLMANTARRVDILEDTISKLVERLDRDIGVDLGARVAALESRAQVIDDMPIELVMKKDESTLASRLARVEDRLAEVVSRVTRLMNPPLDLGSTKEQQVPHERLVPRMDPETYTINLRRMKITIEGPRASGKTHVMALIRQALMDKGGGVVVGGDEGSPGMFRFVQAAEDKLPLVRFSGRVVIEEKATRSTP